MAALPLSSVETETTLYYDNVIAIEKAVTQCLSKKLVWLHRLDMAHDGVLRTDIQAHNLIQADQQHKHFHPSLSSPCMRGQIG